MPNDTSSQPERGFATKAIRTGQDPCRATGATIPPIYQTATFTLEAVGAHKGFDYTRSINPTRVSLEQQLAELEGARFGVAFASGMAAATAVTSLLRQGDHIVATRDIYGGTYRLLVDLLPRWGIETTFVDMTDLHATRAALRPQTKLLLVETPTNPTLRIIDIQAIAALKPSGCLVAVDNTFCSPFLQQPLSLGADLVFHSTTKYINGHSDVVGGVVLTSDPEIRAAVAFWQNAVGAVPGIFDAYLTMRGAKTLALRMREHERNAGTIARWLSERDDLLEVNYPGLPSHPHHELAKRQMKGFGGIVSLRVKGGEARAHEVAKRTKIFILATSLGGVESLICSPRTMTHGSVPRDVQESLGIMPDMLRLSIGIEDVDDLTADLRTALDGVPV